jgi:DNA polymerase-3 subunit alpha
MSHEQKLAYEKEILGVFISGHPLEPFRERFLNSKANIYMIHADEIIHDQHVIIGGIIQGIKEINTKKGDKMAFLTLTDFTSSIEAVIFPKIYSQYRNIITEDGIVVIQAHVSDRDEKKTIIINKIKKLE